MALDAVRSLEVEVPVIVDTPLHPSDLSSEEICRRASYYFYRRRKKIIIGLFFLFSIFTVVYYFYTVQFLGLETQSLSLQRNFWWQLIFSGKSQNQTLPEDNICLHTNQGIKSITDHNGYICTRDSILSNGCCPEVDSLRYSCSNCNSTCCEEYEICVACCLNPENETVQALFDNYYLSNNVMNDTLSIEGNDLSPKKRIMLFELCTALCRTSSHSIHPDHSFKNPQLKFCYM